MDRLGRTARHWTHMVSSGIMVGVLKEQHPDHLLLSDSTHISLPEGLIVEGFAPGARITILYRREDAAGMVIQGVTHSAPSHLPPARHGRG
jgi:hypothetical protein